MSVLALEPVLAKATLLPLMLPPNTVAAAPLVTSVPALVEEVMVPPPIPAPTSEPWLKRLVTIRNLPFKSSVPPAPPMPPRLTARGEGAIAPSALLAPS